MKKWLGLLFLSLFPVLAFAADNSLSFAPPPGDYSVIFLGNLFGVVDGVLHGSGSQIMGVMFGVFNSAVLALGGMIIMYTLMVSTMNTAHEGQMLGQKWSSIWIPVRSTLGLALLIPKASGYCLMQIFIMWVVVQGVGAADKIWEAALSYLNRGGVIIKAQANPATALLAGDATGIPYGAMNILTGEVCMLGIQKQLEKKRSEYLDLKQSKRGPCYQNPSPEMKILCDNVVPDFLGSVNVVAIQSNAAVNPANNYQVNMPNFEPRTPYVSLNGICGTITWNKIDKLAALGSPNGPTTVTNIDAIGVNSALAPLGMSMDQAAIDKTASDAGLGIKLSADELNTAQMSRAIAIQQMYIDLGVVAQAIIGNSPPFKTLNSNNPSTTKNFSDVATQQFGVPYSSSGATCNTAQESCTSWGPTSSGGTNSTVLFNGTEFQGAIATYNGIMQPTLNLLKQASDFTNSQASRKFIAQANSQGWIMAGSYFFDLVKLNGNAAEDILTDSNTGLDKGASYNAAAMQFTNCLSAKKKELCEWFNGNSNDLGLVLQLLDGSIPGVSGGETVAAPKFGTTADADRKAVDSKLSSTVYGFINNSLMVRMPGQPGLEPLRFATLIKFSIDTTPYRLKEQDFDCGRVRILVFSFCLGEMFGNLFYNVILLNMYNFFMAIFQQMINQVIMAFLMIPLQGMGDIFKQGVDTISKAGVNPIVALANMGTMYINFSADLWLQLLTLSVTSSLIPVFGIFIFALIGLALPLLIAWVGVMVSIGFTTAYFIPILPYMIFTFGSIAWLISVIEAMVAAPIVALGVTHPEGHDAFGKGEAAIMILLNVFLRPAMMIIGYISAISLSYVGVWILNAGFDHAIGFIQGDGSDFHDTKEKVETAGGYKWEKNAGFQGDTSGMDSYKDWQQTGGSLERGATSGSVGSGTGNYTGWAGVYAYFFSILIYTTMYLIMVQKAFTLITYLPDKVLRWIGGSPESLGQEASQWGEEMKGSTKEAGGKTQDAQGQMGKQLGGAGQKAVGGMQGGIGSAGGGGGSVSGSGGGEGPEASPDGGDEGGGDVASKGAQVVKDNPELLA
ncbi:MAG: type IV secretion protein DotA [Legionella sp.]|nr:MAG: type IV secretion protein DotA [Legionella sp.]